MQLRQTNKEISLGRYGEEEKFSNPVLQSLGLSFAEACCFLVYLAQWLKQRIEENQTNGEYLGSEETGSHEENEPTEGNQPSEENEPEERTDFNKLLLLPPAICHLASRLLAFIALTLTSTSSFVFFQGTILIFINILRKMFLRESLSLYKWCAISISIMGVVIVGLSDWLIGCDENQDNPNTDLGNLCVVVSMFFFACQLVLEEKYVKKQNLSTMMVVGVEGFFAFPFLLLLLIVLNYMPVELLPGVKFDDVMHGLVQLHNSPNLVLCFTLTAILLCIYQVGL